MVAPTLLDCYAVRDLARFRKVLKGSPGDGDRQSGGNGTSSSYSKSPGHSFSHSLPGPCPPSEVNARDPFGRTALHLICSSIEPSAIDYLHALLSHPSVNINLGDLESGWTALHRALYNGNLLIALTLLRRNDVDIRAKDFEGLTPFDLFNGTIHGSNPLIKGERPNDKLISNRSYLNSGGSSRAASRIGDILDKSRSSRTDDDDEEAEGEIETSNLDEESDAGKASSDLFTWGTNRNFTLGLGDGENRNLPDRVTLKKELPSTLSLPPGAKYERLRVLEVKMSKMHTVALTSERSSNVWVCGIGSNGRLGRSSGTQTAFEPLKDFKERATSVALGVDHTLLTTSNGGIYSFGLNKFNVLGYNVEQGLGTVGSSALNNSSKGGGALSATFGQQPHHSSGGGKQELDIQISPRRLAGPLKKEKVLGVAASKLHSACFTSEGSLFTWGTNTGQLGYDRSATPIQIQPRKVTATALSNPTTSSSSSSSSSSNSSSIQQITATEFATAILLSSWDVIVLHNDGAHRVHFPMNRFGPEISVFRPRQAQPKSTICRLTSSGTTFAALSDMGDLFTFSLNHPSDYANSSAPASQSSLLNSTTANLGGGGGGGAFAALSSSVHHQEPKSSSRPAIIKPQLVWSVRKRFTAVRDVAIGSDGSIILCTESGHVFVRTRRTEAEIPNPGSTEGSNKSKGGSFKFQAIPFLQRITRVSMSDSGGLAAIRSGVSLKEIPIIGNSLSSAFEKLLPHLKMNGQKDEIVNEMEDLVDNGKEDNLGDDEDREVEEEEDTDTEKESFRDSQVRMARLLGEAASRWSKNEDSDNQIKEIPYGYDMFVVAGSRSIPAHRSILASRIPSISSILESPPLKGSGNAPEGVIARKVKCSLDGDRTCVSLSIPGCSFATALFLLHFLYTDQLPAVWTSSIGLAIEKEYSNQKVNKSQIHSQLKNLARLFNLNSLLPCLDSPVPRLPLSTLSSNMSNFFDLHVDVEDYRDSKLRDVELRLEDRIVPCHTAVLRRSPFFSALLQLDWTANRWKDGIIEIEMSHMKWKIGKIILKHLYTDSTFSTFEGVDSNLDKQDEFLDFVVETLAFSNEFLLDKLKSVCQVFLQRRILSNNISAILTDSDTYHCLKLKEVCMEICTRSLETLLESNMLDELGHKALKDLTNHVRKRQDDRMHRSQAKQRLDFLCEIHKDFLDDLDLPKPSLNLVSNKVPNRNSLPPKNNVKMIENSVPTTPLRRKVTWGSPELRPLTQNQVGNGIPTQSIPSLGDAGLMFNMDDEEAETSLENKAQSSKTTTPWKSKSAAERALESSGSKPTSSPSPSPSFSPTPQTNPTSSVDLRSIMAAQQQRPSPLPNSASNSGSVTPIKLSSNSIDSKISVPLNISSKLSQKDRKKQAQAQALAQQQQQAAAASLTSSNLPSSPTNRSSIAPWASTNSGSSTPQPSSPWRRPVSNHPETPPWMSLDGNSQSGNTNGTSPSTLPSSPTPPRSTNSSQSQSFLRKSLSNAASNADHQSSSWSNSVEQSNLGPTYTPVRMQPQGRTSLGGRTASSEAAWTSARSSSVGGLSTNSDFGSSPSPRPFSGGLSSSRPSPSTTTSSFSRTPPLSSTISSNQIPHSSPLTSSSPSIQMTFAQIQEQQRLDLENANALQKAASSKSFAQIIEEEERESEELKKKLLKEEKEKVEFEKWWKEESKRVQKENNAASGGAGKKNKSGGNKGKKNKSTTSAGEGSNPNPSNDAATGSGTAVNAEGESGETNKSSPRGSNRGRGRGNGRGNRGSSNRGRGASVNGNDNHNNRNQQSQQVKDSQPPQ